MTTDCVHDMDPLTSRCRRCGKSKYDLMIAASPEAVRLLDESAARRINPVTYSMAQAVQMVRILQGRGTIAMHPYDSCWSSPRPAIVLPGDGTWGTAELDDVKPDHIIPRDDQTRT